MPISVLTLKDIYYFAFYWISSALMERRRKGPKAWFSFLNPDLSPLDQEPHFFDKDSLEWIAKFEEKYPIIKKELEEFLEKKKLSSFTPYFNTEMVSTAKSWSNLALRFWDIDYPEFADDFKETKKILDTCLPSCTTIYFNHLAPHSTIYPHHGDTNAIVRCHLGITVPASLPEVGFKVGTSSRSWEEGKVLPFCDAHKHTAFNNSNEGRIILLFDVMRKQYEGDRKLVCYTVLKSIYTQKVYFARYKIAFCILIPLLLALLYFL